MVEAIMLWCGLLWRSMDGRFVSCSYIACVWYIAEGKKANRRDQFCLCFPRSVFSDTTSADEAEEQKPSKMGARCERIRSEECQMLSNVPVCGLGLVVVTVIVGESDSVHSGNDWRARSEWLGMGRSSKYERRSLPSR